ncbi:DNA polymerase epsilon subunit 3 [Culex quinquefasciatus]|uniref:DNA polymerase epsilon subunit 3 n=2 Tax=Culex pipiens complex TaxID=518105 RepID=B0XCP4_CULQU|nr:DNA polymerase epsilon subunit 3 [Culex quinquefasciatus]XP_039430146.1 DNA polymerase epsilon subunit 3 [Culex pipiens pallens]EDS33702.1 DNA polymerase epsilon subunit 3 [Culex quinquefasciatus]EDS44940.1 DNA polymerase epsilon subunit 3 [Culex quinquefasciatus]|eukprot:XP_001867416.1 DNA polymerase epsilon subunit 3 [Culex quinquefasciatus]
MVERIEDLNLPNTVVTRLMKEALPADVKISNESRTALTRATSVFVLYLTSAATDVADKKKQKTLTVDHVLAGLEEIEFESFIKPLKNDLENYRKLVKNKKDKKGDKPETEEAMEEDTPADM